MKLKFAFDICTVITGHLSSGAIKGIHCDNCTHYSYQKIQDKREHMCLDTDDIPIFIYPACQDIKSRYSWRKL